MRGVRRTTLIVIFCLAVLAGVGLARKFSFEIGLWSLIFLPALLFLRRKSILAVILVAILGLGIGVWRGGTYMERLAALKSLSTQKVIIEATATNDAIYAQKSQLEFTANKVELLSPKQQSLVGTFKISGFGESMVYRGDRLQVEGKLFPMRGSNQARIAYAQLKRVGQSHSWIDNLSRHFKAGMQTALPEPVASFAMGLLVGQRSTLPQDILNQLTVVGLVHIVAVSGYNVTILVRGIGRLKLPSKYQQLVLSLTLIGVFVLVTGFSASIVRAALVSLLTLWAWYYGRQIRPLALITFVAALTGLLNPFYIWSDLGWYLSFLAFFGVLVIAPVLAKRLFSRPPKILTMVLIETLSAELMTLPLIAMTFGQLSLIALIANLLIVPLVPYAMLLGAVAGVGGAVLPQFAGWIAWPANWLLTYMLDLIHLLANIPSAMIHATISPVLMLSFYSAVLLAVFAARHQTKAKTAILTDEK